MRALKGFVYDWLIEMCKVTEASNILRSWVAHFSGCKREEHGVECVANEVRTPVILTVAMGEGEGGRSD